MQSDQGLLCQHMLKYPLILRVGWAGLSLTLVLPFTCTWNWKLKSWDKIPLLCLLPLNISVIYMYGFTFIFMPHHQKSGGVLCYTLWNFECPSIGPSVSAPTIRLPATPPTVLGQSFSNFTGAFRMVWRYAYCFFQNPEIIFYHIFFIFNLDFFRALILQKCIGSMYLVRAASYSFRPILLKLYRCF